jgi:hypothetical protein
MFSPECELVDDECYGSAYQTAIEKNKEVSPFLLFTFALHLHIVPALKHAPTPYLRSYRTQDRRNIGNPL